MSKRVTVDLDGELLKRFNVVKADKKEGRDFITEKLKEIRKSLREIDEIGDLHGWIFESGKALLLLEQVDKWVGTRELHSINKT